MLDMWERGRVKKAVIVHTCAGWLDVDDDVDGRDRW